ncbi:uncharacterized protein TM35_000421570 [Trypanosoma theileri]|uniref:Methyltransferase n=1 Tax=Trypanosoma theileri TaxID=67003 RepID=A0A1X0NKI9_9TRYP|nr:uncharacterized protein TM35_000421570 [Trypanosoma theileri]ORC84699.1 hypothetical protein TM35_000421570 [Trypanosoma theileri]
MSYFFKSKIPRAWRITAVATTGVMIMGVSFNTWKTLSGKVESIPKFDTNAIVRVEEHARYPCKTFSGYSVVVWNYYLRNSVSNDNLESGNSRNTQKNDNEKNLGDIFRGILALFSNETNKITESADPSANENQLHFVREVVGDGGTPSNTVESSTSMISSSSSSSSVPFVAASTWPAGTSKYAAMTIEPSSNGSAVVGGLLRQLADRATHQSLVRCDPFASASMNCMGDPSYLGAAYLRVLLSAFLLLPSPLPRLRVAVLGVGGGSLPSFLQQYFSQDMTRLDLVDAEPQCFHAAVNDLGMRERMRGGVVAYHIRDGAAFLQDVVGVSGTHVRTSGSHSSSPVIFSDEKEISSVGPQKESGFARRYDVLFVDLFVGSSPPVFLSSVPFLSLCHESLSSVGVAAFNLPAADPVFMDSCHRVFGQQNVYQIPVPASANVVVLARRTTTTHGDINEATRLSKRHFCWRAEELQKTHKLPFDLSGHFPLWWRLW